MRRSLDGGYELDDDPARIDRDVVCAHLATEYWSSHRTREEQERLIDVSTRVIGAYAPGGELVGFCRGVSDGGAVAWLGDVFVLPGHRGRGSDSGVYSRSRATRVSRTLDARPADL